jgi:hypothetical protein
MTGPVGDGEQERTTDMPTITGEPRIIDLDEDGTSLLTVLAGLLLAGLIIAFFAVPTFLGAISGTQNAAAQHNLSTAVVAAKTIYTQDAGAASPYGGLVGTSGVTALKGAEPALSWTDSGPSSGPKAISFAPGTNGLSLKMASYVPATKTCYLALDVESPSSSLVQQINGLGNVSSGFLPHPGTFFASATNVAAGGCSASTTPTSGWSTSSFAAAS